MKRILYLFIPILVLFFPISSFAAWHTAITDDGMGDAIQKVWWDSSDISALPPLTGCTSDSTISQVDTFLITDTIPVTDINNGTVNDNGTLFSTTANYSENNFGGAFSNGDSYGGIALYYQNAGADCWNTIQVINSFALTPPITIPATGGLTVSNSYNDQPNVNIVCKNPDDTINIYDVNNNFSEHYTGQCGSPFSGVLSSRSIGFGTWHACELSNTDGPSDYVSCQSNSFFIQGVDFQVIDSNTPTGPSGDPTVLASGQAIITGFSTSALTGLGSLIPIGAVLLISVAIVYFVIKHFRRMTRS